jgi:hypothetical protein
MATTFTKKKLASTPQWNGASGDQTVLRYNVTTNASGIWVDGDTAAAPTAADELLIGILPAGMRLDDALMIVSDAFTATAAAKVGIRAVDGVTTQDDADYFTASLVLNAVGRYRADNTAVAPITLARDMYLVMDWDTATNAVVGIVDILVYGVLTGTP